MKYITVTLLFGREINVHHDTIEEAAQWGKAHNLTFTQKDLGMCCPEFNCFAEDYSPLLPEAIQRLSKCIHEDVHAKFIAMARKNK